MEEWFLLSGTVRDLYIIETDESGKVKRQIGPSKRKKKYPR
ncbi:hypothetical protein SAMN04487895_103295 [Paenibacillus sophorae]|uniref:Uncharacterized protein n=1 Tax=Paenibacillus sophorae TaxID=1333845 RepID=A0A1H8K5P0_9BACL|nr:hypothetical protein SAMN04487895_103295 [Paenibacillus sophorae]